jgi:hypothetical protein
MGPQRGADHGLSIVGSQCGGETINIHHSAEQLKGAASALPMK